MDYPLLFNEQDRLNALRRAQILDSAPEQAFDKITQRAAEICGTPMAMISLVDEHRQWYKSRVGTELKETPREIAFCSHAIQKDEVMIVPDALADDRFRDNPLVTDDPHVRFYAGVPLVMSDGSALGTLCVVDRMPRELSVEQKAALESLADGARLLIEMRSSPIGELFLKAAETSIEGVTLADCSQPDFPITFANPGFYRMTEYSEWEVIGRNCRFLQGRDTDPAAVARIREGIRQKQTTVVELLNYTKSGRPFWNRLSLIPLVSPAGELTYIAGIQTDITEMREAQAAWHKLDGMITAMNTVNDIVFNFMTSLQLFRMDMEGCAHADRVMLGEFDAMFEETRVKLSRINALTSFKSKLVAPGIAVLDTE